MEQLKEALSDCCKSSVFIDWDRKEKRDKKVCGNCAKECNPVQIKTSPSPTNQIES